MDSKILKRIEKSEHDKYKRLHAKNYGSTGYQQHISEYVQWTTHPDHKILDMGCGRGVAVKRLLLAHRNVMGVDITLMGCGLEFLVRGVVIPVTVNPKHYVEAPLWAMPFKDNQFDYTFSADVLEHLPPQMAEDTIKEIYRVTRNQTLHVISTKPSIRKEKLHLTVQPIEWWREMFGKFNIKDVRVTIVGCEEFLVLHEKKAKEMNIPVKCTCNRAFDNKPKLERHLKIKNSDARHLPDMAHASTHLLFR